MSSLDISAAPKLHKLIEQELADMILGGKFQLGDTLPSERQMMETFKVGRPAVREALLALERAGILRLRSGSPAVVTRVSPKNLLSGLTIPVRSFMNEEAGIRELQDARQLIECAIARRVALQRTAEDLSRMRRALQANAEALGDIPRFEKTDIEFHTEIVKTAHNRVFEGSVHALHDWLLEQRQTTLGMSGQPEKALAFHTRIFEAIERGDADAAETAMKVHMEQTVEVYWQVVTH